MPSPFPGMDPYLEGWLWPDVHHGLASKIQEQLAPAVRPRYVVLVETRVVEDNDPEQEIGIMYPDVHVRQAEPDPSEAPGSTATIVAPVTVPLVAPTAVRVHSVNIREAADRTLVTSIEILSPVNKRSPDIRAFREKWRRLHASGVHLMEIDLLRRGRRWYAHHAFDGAQYLITLTRGGTAAIESWPLTVRDPLPIVPVPLLPPDADVHLDLQRAFSERYDAIGYSSLIDYAADPPGPPFGQDDFSWIRERVAAWHEAHA